MKFFYANEPDKSFRFVKTPKSLFEDEKYVNVSPYAKFLYSFMLDRVSLSKKDEKWVDRDGRVFIYFRIQEVMSLFQIANEKATKLYKELENAGLIQREKNGYGKPTRIYVCDVFEDIHENRESIVTDSVTNCHENRDYIVTKNRTNTHENRDTSLYETEFNETKYNDTNIFPPNPPTGGMGENFSHSPKPDKGKRERRKRESAETVEPLSPEEKARLLSVSPRLCSAVRDWVVCKAEAKRALTPTQKRALLEQIQRNAARYGTDIVAQTVEESTANGYAGIAWSRAEQLKKDKDEQNGQSTYGDYDWHKDPAYQGII